MSETRQQAANEGMTLSEILEECQCVNHADGWDKGRIAGMEEAAQYHIKEAERWETLGGIFNERKGAWHRAEATAIRALKGEAMKDNSRSGWPLKEPQIVFHGPVATHDMPCAVYRELPAVLDCNRGVFEPSWSAQSDGWILIRVRWPWLRRTLHEWFQ